MFKKAGNKLPGVPTLEGNHLEKVLEHEVEMAIRAFSTDKSNMCSGAGTCCRAEAEKAFGNGKQELLGWERRSSERRSVSAIQSSLPRSSAAGTQESSTGYVRAKVHIHPSLSLSLCFTCSHQFIPRSFRLPFLLTPLNSNRLLSSFSRKLRPVLGRGGTGSAEP